LKSFNCHDLCFWPDTSLYVPLEGLQASLPPACRTGRDRQGGYNRNPAKNEFLFIDNVPNSIFQFQKSHHCLNIVYQIFAKFEHPIRRMALLRLQVDDRESQGLIN